MRGLLAEFGIVVPIGFSALKSRIPDILEDAENELTPEMRDLIYVLNERIKFIFEKMDELNSKIKQATRQDSLIAKLETIPGVGPLTASAVVATIGNFGEFKNGRELAAFLGLVPRQNSSGGKHKLLGISKRGDSYLRTLLIHGARSVIRCAERKENQNTWLVTLIGRRNKNVAAVALANKNIRIIWAMATRGKEFDPTYISTGPLIA